MPVVRAGPNQYLLVGHDGTLENRGTAVQAWLRPGTIFVLVPSTKQEAAFEFTQETKDGIPLRFKGTIIYRITDPAAAAQLFDFSSGAGVGQISTLITHVCLGELRHAVSHMTMVECIEQRKTTLTGVVEAASRPTIQEDDEAKAWGISRRSRAGGPGLHRRRGVAPAARGRGSQPDQAARATSPTSSPKQELQLAEMTSAGHVAEKKLASAQEDLRRKEELELVDLARKRRMQAEDLATERQALQLEQERFHSQMEAEQDRLNTESPVRLLQDRE